jgi:hypothetical protein
LRTASERTPASAVGIRGLEKPRAIDGSLSIPRRPASPVEVAAVGVIVPRAADLDPCRSVRPGAGTYVFDCQEGSRSRRRSILLTSGPVVALWQFETAAQEVGGVTVRPGWRCPERINGNER